MGLHNYTELGVCAIGPLKFWNILDTREESGLFRRGRDGEIKLEIQHVQRIQATSYP